MKLRILFVVFLGGLNLGELIYATAPTNNWVSTIQTRITALTNYLKNRASLPTNFLAKNNQEVLTLVNTAPTTVITTPQHCLSNYCATYPAAAGKTLTQTTKPIMTALLNLNVAIGDISNEPRLTNSFYDQLDNLGDALFIVTDDGYTDVLSFNDTSTPPYSVTGVGGTFSERTIVRDFCRNAGFWSNDPRDQNN